MRMAAQCARDRAASHHRWRRRAGRDTPLRVSPAGPSHHVGVDENGLGPRLGPMLVTGVLLRSERGPAALLAAARAAGIGDSKGLCAHGDMAAVEGLVLALLARHRDLRPRAFAELLAALSLYDDDALRAPCPSAGEASAACFGAEIVLPAMGPGALEAHHAAAAALLDAGVTLRGVRCAWECAGRLNDARAAGQGRFDVDLARMVDLVAVLGAEAPRGALSAVCGKVGGRMRYAAALERLGPMVGVLEERPVRSAYAVAGVGEVAFVRDADADDAAVGLASLVGKYLRELSMTRQHAWYAARVEGLKPASGYHDPVTARYVDATALVRRAAGIADRCFER